jgi:hypothetical protein
MHLSFPKFALHFRHLNKMICENYKLQSLSLRTFLQPFLTSYVLGSNIILRNFFTNTPVSYLFKIKITKTTHLGIIVTVKPITVSMRSNACTVFALSNNGIVGSNPTRSMDLCRRLFCVCDVLCAGSGIATG